MDYFNGIWADLGRPRHNSPQTETEQRVNQYCKRIMGEVLSLLLLLLNNEQFSNSQKRMAAMLRKGGRQPRVSSQGNRKFPNIEPVLPIIMRSDRVIVLWTS